MRNGLSGRPAPEAFKKWTRSMFQHLTVTTYLLCLAGTAGLFAQSAQIIPEVQAPGFSLEDIRSVDYPDEKRRSYILQDGRHIEETAWTPINYRRADGSLDSISAYPVQNGKTFIFERQPYPFQVSENGDIRFQISEGLETRFTLVRAGNIDMSRSAGTAIGRDLVFELAPGIRRTVSPRINALKTSIILDQEPEAGPFVIEERFSYPNSCNWRKSTAFNGAIEILNENQNVIGSVRAPYAYDRAGAVVTMEFSPVADKNGLLLRYEVPADWLHDSARQYPVTVDPLVTGPTSVWTGGIIPSCELPNYYRDSIAVTIPAGIMITGFYCTGSYYADPFTLAYMSEGSMYFSTSCGASNALTVNPPVGDSPGTAYIQDGDFRNPLACCLGASCSQRTVYVSFNLGRSYGGGGCNSLYIYYDPTTSWPFRVFVEGHTLESFPPEWSTTPASQCGNECEVEMRAYARYGVPPYTVTHPWMSAPETMGNANFGCTLPFTQKAFTLFRPDCPSECEVANPLMIPPPVITDACNTPVPDLVARPITILPVPKVEMATPVPVFCSGDEAQIQLQSCVPGSDIVWYSGGVIGANPLIDTVFIHAGDDASTVYFFASASANGCFGPADSFAVSVIPVPLPFFNIPEVALVGQPIPLIDSSAYPGSLPMSVFWDVGDGNVYSTAEATHQYAATGQYVVCMTIVNANGCEAMYCDSIQVIPEEVILPNVVTPNGDGQNDLLEIPFLPFYGKSKISVFNRWGIMVYQNSDYKNDWYPENLSEGTYFYVLELDDGKSYISSLNVFR